ncbi:hypothetical protein ACFPFX_27405 [Streptomyces mauvecolor]|uniref:Cystatin domain-containing protein n=1 Tax=Streptomyces mauvecolor TaxID=58345 RepID=A0ABV9US61_9ACTN
MTEQREQGWARTATSGSGPALFCDRRSGQRLALGHVVDADEQVVAGTRYILTIEAAGPAGAARYEAQVWVKPWEDSRQLTDFRAL